MSIKSQLKNKHWRLLTTEDMYKVFENLWVKRKDVLEIKNPQIKWMKLRIWK